MTKISIICNRISLRKGDKFPVQLRVTNERQRQYFTLGMAGQNFKGDDKTFDDKTGRFTNAEKDFRTKNIILSDKEAEANKILAKFEVNGLEFSFQQFALEFRKKALKNQFFSFVEKEISRLILSGRFGYAVPYTVTKDHLDKYANNTKLTFKQIDYPFLMGFEAYLMARKVKKSTVSVYMRTLRTIYNSAIKSHLVKEADYPFYSRSNPSGYSLSGLKYESPKKAISIEQIRQIKDHPIAESETMYNDRNFFMFSYYCRGINFIDMAFLTWNDISGNRLSYTRRKTKRRFNMLLIPEALQIIEYYRGKGQQKYIFPILQTGNDDKTQFNHYKNSLKRFNENLTKLANELELNVHLTSYVARHSWATILKTKGHSIAVISEGLGHETEKITATYLKNFEDSVLDDASMDVI